MMMRDEAEFIYTASIPSKVINGSFLDLFVRYSPKDNMALDYICPELERLENNPSFLTDSVRVCSPLMTQLFLLMHCSLILDDRKLSESGIELLWRVNSGKDQR